MIIVPSSGSTPNPVMLVGEAPGRYEANTGNPFVGPSGDILSMILAHCGANPPYLKASMYLANLVPEYHDGNPDPTNEQIVRWTNQLRNEVITCQPKVILAVGRFAAWWFLGGWHKWGMRDIHGRPCHGGDLYDDNDTDSYPEFITMSCIPNLHDDYCSRAQGAIVVPCFHPATALPDRDPKGDMMAVVWKDFDVAIRIHENGGSCNIPYDKVPTDYIDATGEEFAEYAHDHPHILAIDTEDGATSPWSIQVCSQPGYALTLRIDQPDFNLGIKAIQRHINNNGLVILHFAFHDLPVMRQLDLDVTNINLADTGYMLYQLGGPQYEPQALKIAMWRHCGMVGDTYLATVGDAGRSSQLRYLLDVVLKHYPSPGEYDITLNDGQTTTYRPQSPTTKAKRMIKDMEAGKPVDIWERWHNVSGSGSKARVVKSIYRNVVDDLGPMPRGYLADVYNRDDNGKRRAIRYSSRDPDGTLRLYLSLLPKLVDLGLA